LDIQHFEYPVRPGQLKWDDECTLNEFIKKQLGAPSTMSVPQSISNYLDDIFEHDFTALNLVTNSPDFTFYEKPLSCLDFVYRRDRLAKTLPQAQRAIQ
jgi:hypothetical protein